MFIHNLDPIFIDLGFIAIRWYSLAYVIGILGGWWYGKTYYKKFNFENNSDVLEQFDNLITYLIISIVWR